MTVERNRETRHRRARLDRGGAPVETCPSRHLVQAAIGELGGPLVGARRQQNATPHARGTADFEDVRKVGVELVVDRERHRPEAVVGEPDPFVHRTAPQEPRAEHVNQVLGQRDFTLDEKVAIRHVRAELQIVRARTRAEEQWTVCVQPQLERRQETRAVVIQALLAEAGADDVADRVEDGEGIAVLEHGGCTKGPCRGRQDVILVFDFDDVRHAFSRRMPPRHARATHQPAIERFVRIDHHVE